MNLKLRPCRLDPRDDTNLILGFTNCPVDSILIQVSLY